MEKYLQKNGTVECGLDVKGVQISNLLTAYSQKKNLLTALQLKRRQTKGLENIKIEKKKDKHLVNEMVNILCLFIISCCFLRCDQAVYVLQQPNRTNVEKHRQP